jgi:Putative addiction module component
MRSRAVTVLREALALSEGDRASIAAELLASLPEPEGSVAIDSDEWVREIENRARGVRSGETVFEDWDTVEQRILGKLSNG